uniref:Uncharacterized protein n=1 Tax=Arundo donax TaxID=35708 RepID=A0A0A9EN00_ARUDO
MTRRGARAA